MVRINLLPWRANARAQRRRQFIRLLFVGMLLTLLVLAYTYWHNARLLEATTHDNAYLNAQITLLAEPLQQVRAVRKQRAALLAYQQTVQALQVHRIQNVRLFDELVRTLPDSVYLAEVVQQGDRILIQGQASANVDVSLYLRQLATSPWFQAPRLEVIEQSNAAQVSDMQSFRLTLQQVFIPALATSL